MKGTDTIEGIFLDLSKIRDINLNPQAFANMPNLRFLKFYMPKLFGISDMVCKLHLPQGLQYLSDELRYLHWHGYPLKMLPSNFTPENLIELNLLYSRIEQLWKGKKVCKVVPTQARAGEHTLACIHTPTFFFVKLFYSTN